MTSEEYRKIIRTVVKNILKRELPGIKDKHKQDISNEIATNIHARMYGANVDGVDSPIWRDWQSGENQHTREGLNCKNQPQIDAKELLK